MGLESLSDDDLKAANAGDLSKVSDAGLKILSANSQQFSSTPGGAATGIQRPARQIVDVPESALAIGGAGAMGTALGTVAPEILQAGAMATRAVPQLAPVSNALQFASQAARNAGRVQGAVMGGVSGLASETAGQLADAAGAGPLTGEAIRFAAGAVGPETITAAKRALAIAANMSSLTVESKLKKEAIIKPLAALINGRPQDISQKEADQLNSLVSDLRGGAASDESARGIYSILKTGAQNKIAVSDAEANTIIENAHKKASEELSAAATGKANAEVTAQRVLSHGQDALSTAQLQRLNIGNDLPQSDIGNGLRSVIVARNKAQIAAKTEQFRADEAARDAIVQAKESAGTFINDLPNYKRLLIELQTDAQKRSPDVQRAFDHILASISKKPEQTPPLTNRQIMGYDPKPEVKPTQVNFQVLDDVRRELGQVYKGQPAEGYAAIDAATARKYYDRISQLQQQFAGGKDGPQAKLLQNYADAMGGLEAASSKAGKRVTAMDRYDDTKFVTDASALPRQFFSSKQGIADLMELAGGKAPVVKAALDFATTELKDLNERQVREWMTKRREMLAMLPEVRDAVLQYANTLQKGEAAAMAAEAGSKKLAQQADLNAKRAQIIATRLETSGQTQANQLTTQRNQEATSLLGAKGEMFPVENVRQLIANGDTKQWAQAAPLINAAKGGREMLAGALRQSLADKAMTSTNGLTQFFTNNVRPALEANKLMTSAQMDKIASQLEGIQNMKISEPEKLGIVRRVIAQSFSGYVSSVGGRQYSTGLVHMIPNEQPNYPQAQAR